MHYYWTIIKVGLVCIDRAGILASSDALGIQPDPDRPLRVHLKRIAENSLFSMATHTSEVELHEYLSNDLSWWPWHKYAVLLKTSGDTRGTPLGVGVILAELPPARSRGNDVKPPTESGTSVRLQTFQFTDNQTWFEYTMRVEDFQKQDLRPAWVVY